MNSTLEMKASAGPSASLPDLASSRAERDRDVECAPSVTALDFLLEEREEVRNRSRRHLRHLWLSVWFLPGSVVGLLVTVLQYSVPAPLWVRVLVGIMFAPVAALPRFFQNRYKDDLPELERLRQEIRYTIDGMKTDERTRVMMRGGDGI